jgi:hypothetical protein
MWVLVLIFAFGTNPPQVTIGSYPTRAACAAAGQVWQSPKANPQNTVWTYRCARQ